MTALIRMVLLAMVGLGVYSIAYAAGTPGDQNVAALVGGLFLGIGLVGLIERGAK